MIFSTSSSSRLRRFCGIAVLTAGVLLSGCASWKGGPEEAGRADSSSSKTAAASDGDLIAVLPIDNLTGTNAPLEIVETALREHLDRSGLRIVDGDSLARVMKRYRIRNTGALDERTFRALKEETGATGILITSLEGYADDSPPKLALMSRLVVVGDRPEIAWMDGIGLDGGAHPGLLGIGRIGQIDELVELAAGCLVNSMASSVFGPQTTAPAQSRSEWTRCDSRGDVVRSAAGVLEEHKYQPRNTFRSPILDTDRRSSVAVIPFLNLSQKKNAGKILELHFVNQLLRNTSLAVTEPGLVTEALLAHRAVMEAGPSLENAEALTSDDSLGVDLVLSGVVFDYQDGIGIPKVDFSVTIIDKENRKIVWSSRSDSTGDEGVFFFDLGTVYTAHQLAADMARATSEALSR